MAKLIYKLKLVRQIGDFNIYATNNGVFVVKLGTAEVAYRTSLESAVNYCRLLEEDREIGEFEYTQI